MTLRKKSRNTPRIDGFDHVNDESVEEAWDAEIARRIEDLDSGRVKPVSHDEVLRLLSRATPAP
jgi:putative addiction module component (TIGR02574 family)